MSNCSLQIVRRFRVEGEPLSVEPHGSGHIHDTFVSRARTDRGEVRYVHQRLNRQIFRSPEELMQNLQRVTTHIAAKVAAAGQDPLRRALNIVPALDGQSFYRTPEGQYWRTFRFIEGAQTYDAAQSEDHVYNVGRAFARFQQMIGDLPGPPLHETIPGFGDTRGRFAEFRQALQADAAGRADGAADEVRFGLEREGLAEGFANLLDRGTVPRRIIHFDTKINNVMIDDASGEGICVIDLDTVMPGTALYDFGDAVRLGASRAAEDERDLGRVGVDPALFEALTRGYLEVAREFLTPAEIDRLVLAARAITFSIGLRFLSDYLAGDAYFKTRREQHNLDRCRTQFAMVREMEQTADRLQAIVDRHR